MIAKHVPMRAARLSDYAGLVKYITSELGRAERLGPIRVTNALAEDPKDAASEVRAVQEMNRRAKGDKTYHLIISFPAGENPSVDQLVAIEERVCAGLGYKDHQRVSAVHYDTDNTHIHVAINKIHPERLTIHTPLRDYRTLAQLCDAIENDFGLQKTNHQARKRGGEGRAADMEEAAGLESLIGWVRRSCGGKMLAAETWAELHEVLAEHDLQLKRRGNGFVLTNAEGLAIKASSVSRDLSKHALESRLGAFIEPEGSPVLQPSRRYEKRPVIGTPASDELYAQYVRHREANWEERAGTLREVGAKRRAAIAAVMRRSRLRRSLIKAAGGSREVQFLNYRLAARAQRAAIEKINAAHQCERRRVIALRPQKAWYEWVQDRAKDGDELALAVLRSRNSGSFRPVNGIVVPALVPATSTGSSAVVDHVTKNGTIIFRSKDATIRETGGSLQVARGASDEGIAVALKIARSRFGPELELAGSQAFKERVAHIAGVERIDVIFSDTQLDALRKAKSQGLVQTEVTNDRQQTGRGNRGGIATGRRNGPARARASERMAAGPDVEPGAAGRSGVRARTRADAVADRREPPPQARKRLRHLSELDVVCDGGRRAVLLPSDVHGNVADVQEGRNNDLRRFGALNLSEQQIAAGNQYIDERNSKRDVATDILEHRQYVGGAGSYRFAGIRRIGSETLVLVRQEKTILVLPVDAQSARRASRLQLGDEIQITSEGTVKPRGRRR